MRLYFASKDVRVAIILWHSLTDSLTREVVNLQGHFTGLWIRQAADRALGCAKDLACSTGCATASYHDYLRNAAHCCQGTWRRQMATYLSSVADYGRESER